MASSRSRARSLVTTGLFVVLLAAACGSGGGGDAEVVDRTPASSTTEAAPGSTSPATTTAPEAPATTEAPEDDPEVRARAASVNLAESDFGSDWTSEAATDEDEDEMDEMDACFATVSLDDVKLVSVDSPQFMLEVSEMAVVFVWSSTIVTDTVVSADAILVEVDTNRFAGCALDAMLESFAEDGLEVTGSSFAPVPDPPAWGEAAALLVGGFSATAEDLAFDGRIALSFVQTQDVVTLVAVSAVGETSFETIVQQAGDVVSDRHAAEL